MIKNISPTLLALLACLYALSGLPAKAASLHVNPIQIVLTDSEPIAPLRVRNLGKEEVLLQLEMFRWRQDGKEDLLETTDESVQVLQEALEETRDKIKAAMDEKKEREHEEQKELREANKKLDSLQKLLDKKEENTKI